MNHTKNTSRAVFAVAALSFASLALAGCAPASTGSAPAADCSPAHEGLNTVKAGTLTVGVPENPPFTQTSGNDADGFEIDVVRKLAEAECLALSFVPITYGNGIPMVSTQKSIDIATGGWYVTEDRAKQVGFTTATFYDAMAIVSKSGATTVEELTAMKQVGSGSGYSWEADTEKLLGEALKSYPGPVEMKQDLENGRLDAVLEGFAPATHIYQGSDYIVEAALPDERIAITIDRPILAYPISKDNPELSDALSAQIDVLRADGTLAEILAAKNLPEDLVVPSDVAAKSIR